MRHRTRLLLLSAFTLGVVLASGCGETDTSTPEIAPEVEPFEGLSWGADTTCDIVTWNLKEFPYNGSATLDYVVEAVAALRPDLIGLQEIESGNSFDAVLADLPGYDGYRANSASYDIDLAWMWNTTTVAVDSLYEIFEHDWTAFPRSPLVLHVRVDGAPLVAVNNHFKCCGDGVIGSGDDEEYRRLLASERLAEWAEDEHRDDAVVILGDLNDLLTDAPERNVFQVYLDAPERWRFVDMAIAEDQSLSWSYRNSSHLDHILISDELFATFDKAASDVQTLRLDRFLSGGVAEYQTNLSDHYPVGLRLDLRMD